MDFPTYYRFLKRNQIPFVYYKCGDSVKVLSKITEYEFRMSSYEWVHNHFLIGEPVPQDREVVYEAPEESWAYDRESDHH